MVDGMLNLEVPKVTAGWYRGERTVGGKAQGTAGAEPVSTYYAVTLAKLLSALYLSFLTCKIRD